MSSLRQIVEFSLAVLIVEIEDVLWEIVLKESSGEGGYERCRRSQTSLVRLVQRYAKVMETLRGGYIGA